MNRFLCSVPSYTAPAAIALLAMPAESQVRTETKPMSFDACLATIRAVSGDLGVAPVQHRRDSRCADGALSNL